MQVLICDIISQFCSEKLFMQMADHLAADGFKDVGYEFVNIDVRMRTNETYYRQTYFTYTHKHKINALTVTHE